MEEEHKNPPGRRQFLVKMGKGLVTLGSIYAPFQREVKKQPIATQIEQFEILHQGFSKDELLALEDYFKKVADHLKQNYSTDFSKQKIFIKKVPLEEKKGHGHFSHYRIL